MSDALRIDDFRLRRRFSLRVEMADLAGWVEQRGGGVRPASSSQIIVGGDVALLAWRGGKES